MVFSFCYSRLNSGAARHLAKAGALCDPARHPIGRQHDAKCIDWHCEIAGPNGPGNLIVIVRWNEIDQVPEREPHEDRPCLRMRIDCDTCGSNRQKTHCVLGVRSANPKRWRSAPKTQFTLTPGAIKPERYRVQYEFAGVASVEFLTVPIWDWNFIVIVIAMGAMRTAEKERRHAKSQEDRGQSGRDYR